jgi:DNA polymerase III delta subunit
MTGDMRPESVIKSLEKGHLAPFYLFYGPGEFRTEKLLEKIKASFLPESVRTSTWSFLWAKPRIKSSREQVNALPGQSN